MFALDAASRTLLATCAFAAFGGAFVTAPMVARGEPGIVAEPAPSVARLPSRTAFADVLPRRDPFEGNDVLQPRPVPAAETALNMPAIPVGAHVAPPAQIPAVLRALPPNAGAGDTTFPFPASAPVGAVVTAVITGPHPFALVDEAGTTHVLTIGDRIANDTIAGIDADGVRLSGGTLLHVNSKGRQP